jgi:hypothetical protein
MMKCKRSLVVAVLLLANCALAFGQAKAPPGEPTPFLRNNDVLRMMNAGLKPGAIIAKILTSYCNFDIFPPVLQDLKRRGVPVAVLLAMKAVPSGPPAAFEANKSDVLAITGPVRIPKGTELEVETVYPVTSANMKIGSPIRFQVTRQVFVNDMLVIPRDAIAVARVIRSKPAGRWGRAGMLAWEMEYAVALDGTRIPIQVSGESKGSNRSAAIAGGAIATGALIFPYTSPVGLIWGLKKGQEAVLRGSKPFTAAVRNDIDVAGLRSREGRVIYHNRDTVKASSAPLAPIQFPRESAKPGGGSFRPNR